MKIEEVNFHEYFKLPNTKLDSMFGRIAKGSDVEYRTKFYDGLSVAEVLEMWLPHLTKLDAQWPTLVEFEKDLASKVGPMSIMKPLCDRMDDIESYYESILLDSEPISDAAIQATLRKWGVNGALHERDQWNTVQLMKKSTNSGSPFYDKKRNVLGETLPCAVYWEDSNVEGYPIVYQSVHGSRYKACAILGWRGQEGGPEIDDVKQRIVWMFPFAVNIRELQVYQPLIEVSQQKNVVPAWVSMEAVDERITRLFDTKSRDDVIVCTDFTKFDQHFNPTLQQAAYALLSNMLDNSESSREWLQDVFPIKYNIPLAIDMNTLVVGLHGMGSGSGGTNADETLVHTALQYEAAQRAGRVLNPNSMCLGDDGILSYPGITAKDVTDSYVRHGLSMNLSKQYESKDDCTYLRRWHHRRYRHRGICVGVYSTCRALGRLCEQERFYDPRKWSREMVALRQLSILENLKYHPLKEEFVEFCIRGDKYRLGLDIPGFYRDIVRIADEANEMIPDFLGYTRSQQQAGSIQDWWIVQYMKSKL